MRFIEFYRHAYPSKDTSVSDEDLVAKKVLYEDQPHRLITSIVFEKFVQFYEAGFWCTEHQTAIQQAVLQIKQERILKMMQSDNTRRANDDLNRAFSGVLSDFRKHHEWRMRNRVLNAEEE